jgi:uncharacterized protein
MSEPTSCDRPAWREVVEEAAREAAVADSRTHLDGIDIPFNYRWEHVQAVVRLAIRLAALTNADGEIVEAAAWLHDIAKPHSRNHGRDGAVACRQVLARTDFPREKINAVADAIAKHVGLFTDESLEPIEAAVLWDADKLSKLGATAVLHFVGYQILRGESETAEWLVRLSNIPWHESTVVSFQTQPARAAGRERLDTYRALWRQAGREFGGDDLV